MVKSKSLFLRPASERDGPRLTALAMRSKASNGYDEAFMAACRQELTYRPTRDPQTSVWVAETEEGVAGFFDLRLEGEIAEIHGMFVDPARKHCGIGRRLWERLESEAAALGARVIAADADPTAVGFYAAMGMRIIGERPSASIAGRMLPRLIKAVSTT